MKILVTGAAGFIGSDFVRQAVRTEKYSIVVVDKLTYAADLRRLEEVEHKYKFYKCDISDYLSLEQIFRKEKPEIVVHYAAETHVDRSILSADSFVLSNIVGTYNLLKLSKTFQVQKFIHISTDEVYGELPKNKFLKFKEESSLRPKSPYAATKSAADMLVVSYIKTYNFPAIIVRASNNYGLWQYPEKLIPLSIACVLFNKKIPVYGKGKNVRTWLYVEDFTDAVLKIIKKGKLGEIYNVSSEEEFENIVVVKKILSLLNKDESWIKFVPDRPGHDLRYALDVKKIKKELCWKPKISFDEGLKKTVEWYLEHKSWLKEKMRYVEPFVNKLLDIYSKSI